MWFEHVAAVEKHRQRILDALDYIWHNPETGYREWKTHDYMVRQFEALGYELTCAGDIPGFYTVLDTGRPGPELLILGELDSLIVPDHPDADPVTGAAHACGHAAQCAALVGIVAALKEPGALDDLSGRIRLCAVPAEEMLEIGYRMELQEQGVIKYLGGKTEFLHRGYFDGVDLAFMVHSTDDETCKVTDGSVGFITKQVVYSGVSAHAGGAPWEGVNALYAAQQGLSAVNAIRETFKEKDLIRVHPIITCGGDAVNAIPARVVVESYVRGASFEAINDANRRVNRALTGAALSLGANIDIQDTPGYAPLYQNGDLAQVAADAAALLEIPLTHTHRVGTGSTDMGDVSNVMPALHPYCYGAAGTGHGKDYRIADPEKGCVDNAKWQLVMLHLLLENEAQRAKAVVANFTPAFPSIRAYLEYIDTLTCRGNRIVYTDGGAEVKL